jgi:pyruvate dehydrogenase E2 component (dihydrolipoamide acetyltransferase)/2-oxoglutarate dehydrogenase E2 component (dihydrolipoamide succinyltransferase)
MPQLGMAQDAGKIVSWFKSPGDAVAKGDALFEVETDKATMEVEAQASGFLTGVKAGEGEDVPVGAVIARISESAAETEEASAAAPAADEPAPDTDDLPEGKSVTMPQLGMAQDSGVLVNWLKSPGDEVAADDVLFEVETDKSTMEVEAGTSGFLAATLAEAGEAVPVGQAVAIISADKPANPVARSVNDGAPAPAPSPAVKDDAAPAPKAEAKAPPQSTPATAPDGKILASPKARRLALEQGLDLGRLVKAGHPQPFHVKDLDILRNLPSDEPAKTSAGVAASRTLTAQIATSGFGEFAKWASEAQGLKDADQLLAGFAGASYGTPCVIAVERFGQTRHFSAGAVTLSSVTGTDAPATLTLRDLRGSALRGVAMGGEDTPVLTLMDAGDGGLTLTLECAPHQMDAQAAIAFLTEFAGRMEQPLRHLL